MRDIVSSSFVVFALNVLYYFLITFFLVTHYYTRLRYVIDIAESQSSASITKTMVQMEPKLKEMAFVYADQVPRGGVTWRGSAGQFPFLPMHK